MGESVIDMIVAVLRGTQSRFQEGDVIVEKKTHGVEMRDVLSDSIVLSRAAAQQLVKEAYGQDPKEPTDADIITEDKKEEE